MNSEGLATNLNSETVEAVTYGLANQMKLDQIYVENQKDYKSPAIVNVLPPRQPISDNTVETVEEVKYFNKKLVGSKCPCPSLLRWNNQ